MPSQRDLNQEEPPILVRERTVPRRVQGHGNPLQWFPGLPVHHRAHHTTGTGAEDTQVLLEEVGFGRDADSEDSRGEIFGLRLHLQRVVSGNGAGEVVAGSVGLPLKPFILQRH